MMKIKPDVISAFLNIDGINASDCGLLHPGISAHGDTPQLFSLEPICLSPLKARRLSTTAHRQPSGQTHLLFRADPASSLPKSEATGSGERSLQPQLRSEVDKCFQSYRME